MQNTFYLSSSYLAWLGNEMAQIVTAFETRPKRLSLCWNTSFWKPGNDWKAHFAQRWNKQLVCFPPRHVRQSWIASDASLLSLNLTSGDSLRYGVKKGWITSTKSAGLVPECVSQTASHKKPYLLHQWLELAHLSCCAALVTLTNSICLRLQITSGGSVMFTQWNRRRGSRGGGGGGVSCDDTESASSALFVR